MREFVRARTDAAVVREVLEQHATYHAMVAAEFVRRAHTDDSAEAMRTSERLCPELNAAARWTIAAGHPLAISLAASLAVGVEQYGSDVDSVRTLAMAAHDERVVASASPQQLLELGTGLAFLDVHLVDELAERALAIAGDPKSRLAATHLAGLADAYLDRLPDALAHLDTAERLAIELGDEWQLAAVRQMQGVAFRHASPPDAAAAVAAFESAMRGFALAGDAMHANNARFMMAHSAAADGLEPERAAVWAAQCAEYAGSTGNAHELAHAHLVQAMLRTDAATSAKSISPTPAAADLDDLHDLDELVATFRRLGDLRCVARSLVLRARLADLDARIPLLEEALEAADAASDRPNQTTVLSRLVDAHWACGDRFATLATLDRLGAIAGADAASAACPPELTNELIHSHGQIEHVAP
jgi:hypothetical protein